MKTPFQRTAFSVSEGTLRPVRETCTVRIGIFCEFSACLSPITSPLPLTNRTGTCILIKPASSSIKPASSVITTPLLEVKPTYTKWNVHRFRASSTTVVLITSLMLRSDTARSPEGTPHLYMIAGSTTLSETTA